ncbi:pilus assembly protein PilS, partial [Neisseria meningitidis]
MDSRLRGNDEAIHTEIYIPSFPRKWESRTQNL